MNKILNDKKKWFEFLSSCKFWLLEHRIKLHSLKEKKWTCMLQIYFVFGMLCIEDKPFGREIFLKPELETFEV